MLCYQGQMAGEPAFLRMTRVRMSVEPNRNHLIFFAKSLDECFAVGIEQFLAALLPRRSHLRLRDVPIRAAFLEDGAQVLPEIFHRGTAEKPVTVVDLVNDKARLEDNHVGNHRIVDGIGVFGDIEIFLDEAARVGEESPVSADSGTIFIGLGDIVGTDRDHPAIRYLELTMEVNQPFSLPAVLGAETPAA